MSIPGDPFRRVYNKNTAEQQADMEATQVMYEHVWEQLNRMAKEYGHGRDGAMAKIHLQESCMWAVRAITGLPDQE